MVNLVPLCSVTYPNFLVSCLVMDDSRSVGSLREDLDDLGSKRLENEDRSVPALLCL